MNWLTFWRRNPLRNRHCRCRCCRKTDNAKLQLVLLQSELTRERDNAAWLSDMVVFQKTLTDKLANHDILRTKIDELDLACGDLSKQLSEAETYILELKLEREQLQEQLTHSGEEEINALATSLSQCQEELGSTQEKLAIANKAVEYHMNRCVQINEAWADTRRELHIQQDVIAVAYGQLEDLEKKLLGPKTAKENDSGDGDCNSNGNKPKPRRKPGDGK